MRLSFDKLSACFDEPPFFVDEFPSRFDEAAPPIDKEDVKERRCLFSGALLHEQGVAHRVFHPAWSLSHGGPQAVPQGGLLLAGRADRGLLAGGNVAE